MERPPGFDHVRGDDYAYLLGAYLGDGWIGEGRRGVQVLRISVDARHPGIAQRIQAAMQAVMPANRVAIAARRGACCVDVCCYSKRWSAALPQHGEGPKHTRPISLAAWQRVITAQHPQALIRGLIHSDGSRYVATVRASGRTYHYVRYAFTNRSEDIKAIFCEHLDLLGIPWTRPNAKNIEITRRGAVRLLDRFVGPKT